jgi:uncharacterized protein YkwD
MKKNITIAIMLAITVCACGLTTTAVAKKTEKTNENIKVTMKDINETHPAETTATATAISISKSNDTNFSEITQPTFSIEIVPTEPTEPTVSTEPATTIEVFIETPTAPPVELVTEPTTPPTVPPTMPPTEVPTIPPTIPTTEPPTIPTDENVLNSQYSPNEMELAILNIVNQRRAEAGVHPLEFGYFYYDCARARATECDGYFSHSRPNGTKWHTIFDEYSVCTEPRYTGENIAQFFSDAESVMEGFMNSPGHRNNILSANFDYMAVAVCESAEYPGHYTVVQLFASKIVY